MNRWTRREGSRRQQPRQPLKGEPQFTMDDLYISPFTHELTSDEQGRTGYTPMDVNLRPMGIRVMDDYLEALHAGQSDVGEFCARLGAKTSDLDGLVFLLTGMSNQDFRNRWIVRRADDLLRYTDMDVKEIARRSGAGSRNNLYFIYERDLNCSPTMRRQQLRQEGDLGRFK